jgi:Fe-Mn family superoxide dismutase
MSAYPNQEVNFVLLLMSLNRRQFIYLLGATVGTATLAGFNPAAFAATGPYSLIALPYSYDALVDCFS